MRRAELIILLAMKRPVRVTGLQWNMDHHLFTPLSCKIGRVTMIPTLVIGLIASAET